MDFAEELPEGEGASTEPAQQEWTWHVQEAQEHRNAGALAREGASGTRGQQLSCHMRLCEPKGS